MDTRHPDDVPLDPNTGFRPDRRSRERQPDPPCPRCQYEWISVTLRTTLDFHCECQVCGERWAVSKPGAIFH